MSKDTIYREDAIKAVWGEDINPSEDGVVFEAQSHIDRDIRLIPSADRPQGEWIPCSEGMPKKTGYYICTCYDGACYRTSVLKWLTGWVLTGTRSYWKVMAWMPLPEPWKGADDE